MCLSTVWPDSKTKRWLKDKPKSVVTYKVVVIKRKAGDKARVFPAVFDQNRSFKKTNRLLKREIEDEFSEKWLKWGSDFELGEEYKYQANYHLFVKKEDAERFITLPSEDIKILKCEVLKKDITAMGEQYNSTVIVAKKFEFVEGLQYFGEKKI